MKFKEGKFYRRHGDCCDFMKVIEVQICDSSAAEIKVSWNTKIGRKRWKTLIRSMSMRIVGKEFKKWNEFIPSGEKVED